MIMKLMVLLSTSYNYDSMLIMQTRMTAATKRMKRKIVLGLLNTGVNTEVHIH